MDENSQRLVFTLVLPSLVIFDPALLGEARSVPRVGLSRGSDLCGRFLFRAKKKKQQESLIFQTKDDISSDALYSGGGSTVLHQFPLPPVFYSHE